MKKATLVAGFILGLLAFALPAAAQTGNNQSHLFAPYVDAGISASSTFTGTGSVSASNPNYNVGLGIESNEKYTYFNFDGQFSSANIRTFGLGSGDAFTGTLVAEGYGKIHWLLIGGGVRWSDQVINGDVSALIPNVNELVGRVGMGAMFSRDFFTLNYVLPGRNTVAHQNEVDFHNELNLTRGGHFRLTQDLVGSTGDSGVVIPGLSTARLSGGSAGVGVKVVF